MGGLRPVSEKISEADIAWADEQVAQYARVLPTYTQYAAVLQRVLEHIADAFAPQSMVQTRPKSVPSFSGKIWRKRKESPDPVHQFTDLCGGRIIANNRDEVKALCDYITNHFKVDWDNSVDISQRLKPSEFGYRSVHYVVQFRPGEFPNATVPREIPEDLYGLKAEIQVRTLLEHSWADFSHRVLYKRPFKTPERWEREMAKLAAFLEEADCQLIRVQNGLRHYLSCYNAYMTSGEIAREITILENVLKYNRDDVTLAHEIAMLAMENGDWKKAVDILASFRDSAYIPAVKDLGIALCNLSSENKKGREYRDGQHLLKRIIEKDPENVPVHVALAATYRDLDEDEAERLYNRAFSMSPDDPQVLCYYLDYAISAKRDLTVVKSLIPVINEAYRKSRELASAGLQLPWAYYNMGKFSLLLGKEYDALAYYAKAIQLSRNTSWPIRLALRSLKKLFPLHDSIKGYHQVLRLLWLGMLVHHPGEIHPRDCEYLKALKETLSLPLVIVAGGTDAQVEKEMESFGTLLGEGFRDFRGTVISGGTRAGISGLVGDLQEHYRDHLNTIGYVPGSLPAGELIDARYSCVHKTSGTTFSPDEPLQYWTDIVLSGIRPADVKLIGINGGAISSFEYRIAVALGAKTGILRESGRAALDIMRDPDWCKEFNFIPLPRDAQTIRAFVGSGIPELEESEREVLARHIHKEYQKMQMISYKKDRKNRSLYDWGQLDQELKESNRRQADHMLVKLRECGYDIQRVPGRPIAIVSFTHEEIEHLAMMEHGRWNAERLGEGWKLGQKKDLDRRINPYLIPWDQLPEDVKDWDRNTVRKIPEMLAKIGYEVYKLS